LRNLKELKLNLPQVTSGTVLPIPKYRNGTNLDGKLHSGDAFVTNFSFQLLSFEIDTECDIDLAKFIHSQKSIKKLSLGAPGDHAFKEYISFYKQHIPDFLPNLMDLDCIADLSGPLIYGRPVTHIQLQLMEEGSEALQHLRTSGAKTGVHQLILVYPLSTSPLTLLQQIAGIVPRLVHLTIYFDTDHVFNEPYLVSLTPTLGLFKALQFLLLPTSPTSDCLRDVRSEKSIVEYWASKMPALRTVLMPSSRFFVGIFVCTECHGVELDLPLNFKKCIHLMGDPGDRRRLQKRWISETTVT